MLLKLLREVERDDVDVEGGTCLLQRLFVCGPRRDQVIVLLELGDAEVVGGIGEEDVAPPQNAQS